VEAQDVANKPAPTTNVDHTSILVWDAFISAFTSSVLVAGLLQV